MIPYILTYFAIFILALDSYFKNRSNKVVFLIVALFIGILSGTRVETLGGYDTSVYKLMYENVRGYTDFVNPEHFLLQTTERGYILLMAFIKSLGFNFNYFLLILGLFSGAVLFFVFTKYTKYAFVVLAIFLSKGYLYYFFTAQRQVIAMCICWLAITFVIKKKFIPFIILVILASLFHYSAIVFLVVYFIDRIKLNNKHVITLIIVAILTGVFKLGIMLGSALSNILPFGGEKLSGYVTGNDGGINVLNFIELIPILFLVLSNRNDITNRTPYYNLFFNIYLLYILITFAFYDFSFIARLKGYFVIGYIIVIASLLDVTEKKKIGIGILVLILLYCFAVMIRELLVFDEGTGYLPYKSFLFI